MSQHAPRGITIVFAAILVVVGILGTFLGLIPDIGGVAGTTTGVVAYAAATVVMLVGVFTRGV
jgi:uncharacterized membrane protein YhhN